MSINKYATDPNKYNEWLTYFNDVEIKHFDRVGVTIDTLILTYSKEEKKIKLYLNKREEHPFINQWALHGTILHFDEDSEDEAIKRLFSDKLLLNDLSSVVTEQLKTFTKNDRDPRHFASIAHLSYIEQGEKLLPNRENHQWFDLFDLPDNLAFDHNEIIQEAIQRIKNSLYYKPNILLTIKSGFYIKDAINIYKLFDPLNKKINNISNFRTLNDKFYIKTNKRKSDNPGKPALIYQYKYIN